mmetsp:Transcript_41699/g.130629  ORF Transcript_41699/g.130629 Transcript_41699/m.130629 type:complete len:522 (+) Transcript_41699:232-1797(+)
MADDLARRHVGVVVPPAPDLGHEHHGQDGAVVEPQRHGQHDELRRVRRRVAADERQDGNAPNDDLQVAEERDANPAALVELARHEPRPVAEVDAVDERDDVPQEDGAADDGARLGRDATPVAAHARPELVVIVAVALVAHGVHHGVGHEQRELHEHGQRQVVVEVVPQVHVRARERRPRHVHDGLHAEHLGEEGVEGEVEADAVEPREHGAGQVGALAAIVEAQRNDGGGGDERPEGDEDEELRLRLADDRVPDVVLRPGGGGDGRDGHDRHEHADRREHAFGDVVHVLGGLAAQAAEHARVRRDMRVVAIGARRGARRGVEVARLGVVRREDDLARAVLAGLQRRGVAPLVVPVLVEGDGPVEGVADVHAGRHVRHDEVVLLVVLEERRWVRHRPVAVHGLHGLDEGAEAARHVRRHVRVAVPEARRVHVLVVADIQHLVVLRVGILVADLRRAHGVRAVDAEAGARVVAPGHLRRPDALRGQLRAQRPQVVKGDAVRIVVDRQHDDVGPERRDGVEVRS